MTTHPTLSRTLTPGPALEERLDLRLLGHRMLLVEGELDDAVAARVCAQLLLLAAEDADAPTGIYLASESGTSSAALRVVDTVTVLPTPVTTVAVGAVIGPALLVLASGEPGRRRALPGSVLTLRSSGTTGVGLALDARQRTAGAEEADRTWPGLLAERTGLSLDSVRQHLRDGLRLTAADAVDHGLVDRVLDAARAVTPSRITDPA